MTENHCSMLMPCDCSWRTVLSTRRCRSLCTSDSGGSISVSPVSASVTRPTSSWRAWLSLDCRDALAIDARHAVDGVELAEVLVDPLVGEPRAATSSCTGVDGDDEVGRLARCPSASAVNVSSSPAEAPIELVVEVVGDPALADLVGPVLGVQPGDLLAVAGGGEVERDEVAAGRRAVDVGELAVAAQLGLHGLVDLGVGGHRAPAARRAGRRSRAR